MTTEIARANQHKIVYTAVPPGAYLYTQDFRQQSRPVTDALAAFRLQGYIGNWSPTSKVLGMDTPIPDANLQHMDWVRTTRQEILAQA